MVSFYANVITRNYAWRHGYFFSPLIGREEREAADAAVGKVAPLSFVGYQERILSSVISTKASPQPSVRGVHLAV